MRHTNSSARSSAKNLFLAVLAILLISAGCDHLPGGIGATPTPAFTPTPVTFAEDTARAFLKAWSAGDYNAMYTLLAPSRRETVTAEQFVARYQGITTEATIKSIQVTVNSVHEEGIEAEAKYTVAMETYTVGTVQYDNTMLLRREEGRWGVLWNPGLIFPQLTGGGSVHYLPVIPTRGQIYARDGNRLLAKSEDVYVIEVVPAEIKNENAVLSALGRMFNKQPGVIKAMYSNSPGDWRIQIGTLNQEQVKANLDALSQPGIYSDQTKDSHTYPEGTLAAHVIGYVGQVSAEELAQLQVKGYREGDLIGKAGLELWGEQYLAGQRGGKLVILSPSGEITATLASVPAQKSQNIYTTLDIDVQQIVEKALGNRIGAAVVMDVSSGDILALASHPTWDPNRLSQKMTPQDFRALINDPSDPLVNRVTQGAFPPGSVFKIVAYSAALEKGGMTQNTMFNDPGYWDGLGQNFRKYNWTWSITGKGLGTMTLSSALTQSDDVVFYQVGQRLDQIDHNLLPTFARAFGLGTTTDIELGESPGNVPDPSKGTWRPGDAINLVIGQGDLLTTPLQIVDIMAAIANGGTLYRPRLVTKTGGLDPKGGSSGKNFPVETRGRLPISAATLASIRQALARVTTEKEGTAYSAFRGAKISVAGKTGTAEVLKTNEPHSWFAAYAPADNPKIAVVVFAEHGGEGSTTAAPIVREIVEGYFALPNK